jgi:hypothetical protein
MCGIAEVFGGIVECGWNERNGTTEYPEHTEASANGESRAEWNRPIPDEDTSPPLCLGGRQEMGNSGKGAERASVRTAGVIFMFPSGGEYHKESTVSIQT